MIRGNVDYTGSDPQEEDSPAFTITVSDGCSFCPANHLLPLDEAQGDVLPEDMKIEVKGDDQTINFSPFHDSFSLTCVSDSNCGQIEHFFEMLDGSTLPFDHELTKETQNLMQLTAWSDDNANLGQEYNVQVRAVMTRPDGTTEQLLSSPFIISFDIQEECEALTSLISKGIPNREADVGKFFSMRLPTA